MNDTPRRPASGEQRYAGERLGLPQSGPGSVAGWGKRFLALLIDWVASSLTAALAFGYEWFGATAGEQGIVGITPILVFVAEATLLTALVGGSFGQLVVRIGVAGVGGRPVTLLKALLRSVLIVLVIPPLVYNRDQRGLHDLAAGTVVVRR